MSPNKRGNSMDGMRKPAPANRPKVTKMEKLPEPKLETPVTKPKSNPMDNIELDTIPKRDSPKIATPTLRKKSFWLKTIGAVLLAVITVASLAGYLWYAGQLSPLSEDTSKRVRMVIQPGTTPNQIAERLQSEEVIRSSVAFMVYVKLTGKENNLKAGAYNLQPSLSTPAIVDQLVDGSQDTFRVTFLPGETLANNRKVLLDLGLYSETEVDSALAKDYDHPLLASKPDGADLEGYIFGETYEFHASATVETILTRTFDQYWSVMEEHNIVAGFKKQGLNLHDGIILSSIVEREVSHDYADQRKVAKVFLNRLELGMPLGADATFVYAAKQLGVAPSTKLDSPYNTRIYGGLPPGPISAPGEGALRAVADPANVDFIFFVSGDDGKTYFSKTEDQHQANIAAHCHKNCNLF